MSDAIGDEFLQSDPNDKNPVCQLVGKMKLLAETVVKKVCDSQADQSKIGRDLLKKTCNWLANGKFPENFICILNKNVEYFVLKVYRLF